MKKYKVAGRNLETLLKKVAEKFKVNINEVGYNIIDKTNEKISLEVWKKKENITVKNEDEINKFKLNVSEEGVFLTIAEGNIDFNEVIEFIAEKDIEAPDMEQLSLAFENRRKKVKIAEFYEGIYKESEIEVEVSPDKMKAYIILSEPKGMNLPVKEKIKTKLLENKIIYGIKDQYIDELLKNKKFNIPHLVAEGDMPEDGIDGYIDYKVKSVNKRSLLKPMALEDGKVDFKQLEIIENVVEGQVLAVKIPAELGKNGKNIFAEEIKSKNGKDVPIKLGKNTKLSDSGFEIISKIDGMVSFSEGKLSVANVYATPEVGVLTGNIDFVGSVIVKGDVKDGYEIKADGNIEVVGNVEKAKLISTGDVVIRGSFFGKNIGKIESKGDIVVNFAESAIIESEKDVIGNEAFMNCKIFAHGKMKVIDKKGVIIGGKTSAGEGLEAINIGSHLAVKTEIEVGSNPKIVEKIKKLELELKESEKKMSQIDKNINLLNKLKMAMKESMPQDKLLLLKQLSTAKFSMSKHAKEIKYDIEENRKLSENIKDATVDVHGICYPGVKIKIRKGTYFVKEKIQNVRFYYENAEVKITALK
ncbi:DUF342 domain-containing protein [Haliovirga abyssi]|uniref:Polymerase n=1 Tax=Haliovirga abyssi TaxID=2996794 RepID=A0AAU9D6F8_9FUSO|nr:FapA family protein [Haliovirga abyssi]BDU50133.1 polymerase [Haliovirga abyssi]